MANLSEEQLKSLNKEALILIVSALQSQLDALQSQLDSANAMLSENNKQINLLTEQIRIMNQRQYGRKSESSLNEIDGQLSLFDSFNEAEVLSKPSEPEPEIDKIIIPSYTRSKKAKASVRLILRISLRVYSNILFRKKNSTDYFPMVIKNCPLRYISVFI